MGVGVWVCVWEGGDEGGGVSWPGGWAGQRSSAANGTVWEEQPHPLPFPLKSTRAGTVSAKTITCRRISAHLVGRA